MTVLVAVTGAGQVEGVVVVLTVVVVMTTAVMVEVLRARVTVVVRAPEVTVLWFE